jgi:hypothetical protein
MKNEKYKKTRKKQGLAKAIKPMIDEEDILY